jgi:Tfp pilus assembly protein PilP
VRRLLLIFWSSLLLAACDDSTARQYLAQCKLESAAQIENFTLIQHYNDTYLENCMQAKGYVQDGKLTALGKSCFDLIWSAEQASCYRPDNEMGRLLYENF